LHTKNRKFPLFSQYFFTYFIVLLIPLSIMGYFVYFYFVQIVKDEVTTSNESMLIQMRDIVDDRWSEFNKISAQITMKHELSPEALTRSFVNVREAMTYLNFTAANEFLHDVLFYVRGGEYLYSSATTYPLSNFINNVYDYSDWSEAQFTKEINGIKLPVLRTAENIHHARSGDERMVTYMVPIPINSPDPYGTVLFLMKESSFQQMLKAIINDRVGNAAILDEHGRIVTSLFDDQYLHSEAFRDIVQDVKHNQTQMISMEQTNYIASYVRSEKSGWTYATLLPEANVMQPVKDVEQKMLFSLLLILVIGGLVIYYAMQLNYNPIRKLIHLADKLSDQLSSSKPALKQYLLSQLLKGRIPDMAQFNDRGKDVGVSFTKPVYCAVVIERSGQLEQMEAGKYAEQWLERLPQGMEGYYVDVFDEDKLVFIIAYEQDMAAWKTQFIEHHERISREWAMPLTVGVGNGYRESRDIGKSYMEATTAVHYRLIKGTNKMLFFDEVAPENTEQFWYPKLELEQLEANIRIGNVQRLEETIHRIVETIKQQSASLFVARCICFDMINTIMKTMYDLRLDEIRAENKYPDVLALTKFHTIEELADIVTGVCAEVCSRIGKQNGGQDNALLQSMRAYLHAHYNDYHFSLQQAADHFNVSTSYFSRTFKEQTGQTVLEYVNHLRIERAKQLLLTTDDQLQEVVNQIGYSDVSSFIRKFKQLAQMTPTDYRKSRANRKAASQ